MQKQNSWLEIDANSLEHNITEYKRIIGNAHLAFVVKGNAYGHGIDQIIELTKNHPLIDWYCTASLSEALHIRTLGSKKNILVMCSIDQDPYLAIAQQIDLVVYDTHSLELIIKAAQKHKAIARIHLKVDTGLSRFGFLPNEILPIIQMFQHNSHIALNGIFTHFANAENIDQQYTDIQVAHFANLIKQLKKNQIEIPYIHSHATSATIKQSNGYTNFMRIGAGMYGLWPSEVVKDDAYKKYQLTLKQILTWKTHICSTRTIEKDKLVGYGLTYKTARKTRLAFLPIGYADGYHRRLSNVGNVLIENRYAPVIGRTAMNVITVDITDIPSAKIGTEVILMGNHQGITAYDLAKQMESFNPREITTRLSAHIPRIIDSSCVSAIISTSAGIHECAHRS
ncbi:MAG: alanine racemase [Candidatus Dependentiae bacterium]